MVRKEYQKPFMVVERFVTNECVAACWYVKSSDILTELYEDKNKSKGRFGLSDYWGYYDTGEKVETEYIAIRIPQTGWINESVPNNIGKSNNNNGGAFFTSYSGNGDIFVAKPSYDSGSIVKDLYSYSFEGTTYYFKDFTEDKNKNRTS